MSSTIENQTTPAAPVLPTPPTPTNFRLPGPTQVPPEVAAAGAWPMINHRSPEFNAIVERVTAGLKYFFQTENDVLCFPGSGSSGWEATVANCFSPGDQVAVISIGNFGERFALVARAFGLTVEMIEFEWGQAADPDVVAQRLRAMPNVRGVFVTHNETSTGVMNDLAALSRAIHAAAPDALISVDAVSSLGCVSLPIDALDLDIVFTGSQKGWMCPPGLMMISIGPRAFAACTTAKLPRFYWDLQIARKSFAGGGPPYTPPVSIWYQLDVALAMMRAEGREQVFARHAAIVKHAHQRLQQMGLTLFADPQHYSHTVTAVNAPEGVDVSALLKTLKLEDRVVFQGGQAKLAGKIFRIGHMGFVSIADIDAALDALQRRLQK